MKSFVTVLLLTILCAGCGPNKELLKETKFDASLKEKISSLAEDAPPEMLTITGKCDSTVDASMRQDLIDAGAEVQTMRGDLFTAMVSSDDVYKVANLGFVTQLQLSKPSKSRHK